MAIFFLSDKLWTLTYLLFVQTCWPWSAIHKRCSKATIKVCFSQSIAGFTFFFLENKQVWKCYSHHLMALYFEKTGAGGCKYAPQQRPKIQLLFLPHCSIVMPSLKEEKMIRGTPPSICQKVLKQVVIIYGALLWCLVGAACLRDTDMNFHFRCSSPMAVVSMMLWPAFPKCLADAFYLLSFLKTLKSSNDERWKEVEDGGNKCWATIATCHFIRLSISFFIFCNLWNDGRHASDGGRQVKIWTADTSQRITWIWTTRLLMGIHTHFPLPKALL